MPAIKRNILTLFFLLLSVAVPFGCTDDNVQMTGTSFTGTYRVLYLVDNSDDAIITDPHPGHPLQIHFSGDLRDTLFHYQCNGPKSRFSGGYSVKPSNTLKVYPGNMPDGIPTPFEHQFLMALNRVHSFRLADGKRVALFYGSNDSFIVMEPLGPEAESAGGTSSAR